MKVWWQPCPALRSASVSVSDKHQVPHLHPGCVVRPSLVLVILCSQWEPSLPSFGRGRATGGSHSCREHSAAPTAWTARQAQTLGQDPRRRLRLSRPSDRSAHLSSHQDHWRGNQGLRRQDGCRRAGLLGRQALADWNTSAASQPDRVADGMVGVRTDAELRRELSNSRDQTVSSSVAIAKSASPMCSARALQVRRQLSAYPVCTGSRAYRLSTMST